MAKNCGNTENLLFHCNLDNAISLLTPYMVSHITVYDPPLTSLTSPYYAALTIFRVMSTKHSKNTVAF